MIKMSKPNTHLLLGRIDFLSIWRDPPLKKTAISPSYQLLRIKRNPFFSYDGFSFPRKEKRLVFKVFLTSINRLQILLVFDN